jgi:DNA modification methylase
MTVSVLTGDCREVLRTLPDESVHCVVTSPPYWGLRDYGVVGQLGLEPSLAEHVETMRSVFAEVRRVLRADGTLWLNYGDSYATAPNGRSAADTKAAGRDDRTFRDKPFSTVGNGLKAKDLCGTPWGVAFALQADGWWLRSDIIWSKPNPMPESITDRPTKAHEYVFLMSKSERYFYDAEAIKERSITNDPRRPYTSEGAKQLDGRARSFISGAIAAARRYRHHRQSASSQTRWSS